MPSDLLCRLPAALIDVDKHSYLHCAEMLMLCERQVDMIFRDTNIVYCNIFALNITVTLLAIFKKLINYINTSYIDMCMTLRVSLLV